jgi:hypothetical protein
MWRVGAAAAVCLGMGCGNQEPPKAEPKGGVEVKAPGVSVKVGRGGADVKAPGVDVKAGDKGADVKAPGVKVKVKDNDD